ncbi:MAG: 3'-5' exoribonuclease domain-containing protein [Solirubrobacteraceae bacterium]
MADIADIYISADIEADGPIPGEFSMLAFGLAVAATFDGEVFTPQNPSEQTFYRELKPIAERYEPAALKAARLDREALVLDGAEPEAAMRDAADWVATQADEAGGARPVLVGYPVVFDWMFLHWYFVRFAGESPFGFSGALDIKTIYQQKAQVTLDYAGRNDLPNELRASHPHTHNALDDAIEQAEIFARVWAWEAGA